jgi:Flp pilus assembly protein CpaB
MPTLSKNIIISVVLALCAAVALVLYVGDVQNQAATNEHTVAVVVAVKDVPAGTSVDDAITSGALGIRTMRVADVPRLAVTNYDAIRGQVVSQPLFTGDTVTTSRIGSSNGASPSYQVKGNQRLIRLPLYQKQGMLTDIAPHDRVDIWAKVANADATSFSEQLIVRGALVAAADDPATSSSGQGSLLLAMALPDAGKVAAALAADSSGQSDNNIWVVLDGRKHPTWKDVPTIPLSR